MSNFVLDYKEAELAEAMSETQRTSAWSGLVARVETCKTAEDMLESVKDMEDEYMEQMYARVPEAKKKDGSWKYRRFEFTNVDGELTRGGLPLAYISAKSTVKGAIEHGIPLTNGDGSVPKSVIARSLKDAKTPKSHYDLAKAQANTLGKHMAHLTDVELHHVRNILEDSRMEELGK